VDRVIFKVLNKRLIQKQHFDHKLEQLSAKPERQEDISESDGRKV
jgi:hypothetical protein